MIAICVQQLLAYGIADLLEVSLNCKITCWSALLERNV